MASTENALQAPILVTVNDHHCPSMRDLILSLEIPEEDHVHTTEHGGESFRLKRDYPVTFLLKEIHQPSEHHHCRRFTVKILSMIRAPLFSRGQFAKYQSHLLIIGRVLYVEGMPIDNMMIHGIYTPDQRSGAFQAKPEKEMIDAIRSFMFGSFSEEFVKGIRHAHWNLEM